MSVLASNLCTDTADRLSAWVGDFDCEASYLLELRSPADLSNWTLPALEALMVLGAALALVFSWRRFRGDGDGTTLAMALAGVVYVLVVEIPMYFPEKLGLGDYLGTVFVHNVFTVEFIVDRLPLYIVALYVALPVLAYEVVRGLGVFERRGDALGALCVGVVHSAFYEAFDHLGPQLRWWAWNEDNKWNRPFFESVPMTSVTLFSLVAPAALVWMMRRWVSGRRLGLAATLGRGAVIGAVVPVSMAIAALPATAFGGDDPNTTAQAIALAAELAVAWAIAVPVLVGAWRDGAAAPSLPVRVFGPIYVVVMALLWASAVPDLLDAVDGTTPDGTPVGSLPFAAVCLVAGTLALAAAGAFGGRAGLERRRGGQPVGAQGMGRSTAE